VNQKGSVTNANDYHLSPTPLYYPKVDIDNQCLID
jgi:hypothetical protein